MPAGYGRGAMGENPSPSSVQNRAAEHCRLYLFIQISMGVLDTLKTVSPNKK
jgi:hypothetical protein